MKRLALEWRDYFLTCLIEGISLQNPVTFLLWLLWVSLAVGLAAIVWKHHYSVTLSLAVGIGAFLIATFIAFTISKCAGR